MHTQRVEVIPGPGVFENDIPLVVSRAKQVENLVEWVQIDIADGDLVPSTTPISPQEYHELFDLDVSYELHMMVQAPVSLSERWIDAGVKRILWHVESSELSPDTHDVGHIRELIQKFQRQGVEVGLAVDKQTNQGVLYPFIDIIDCALVMTIQAGYSGQDFIPLLLEKVTILRQKRHDLPIEVDGGINVDTAPLSVKAGATRLAATSGIYKTDNIAKAIKALQSIET